MTPEDSVGRPVLIIFCDASKTCYGAVAYARWQLENGQFSSRFIVSKNRVAPLKARSIPQLELNACVIGARLNDKILGDSRLAFEKSIIFTDSMISLAWIRTESRILKPYESVRVGEIHMKSERESWRHVSSEKNTADDLTRGLRLQELNGRWEKGDPFLARPEEEWTKSQQILSDEEKDTVRKAVVKKSNVNLVREDTAEQYIKQFSALNRAVRVTAYRNRFIAVLKHRAAETRISKMKRQIMTFRDLSELKAKIEQKTFNYSAIAATRVEIDNARISLIIDAQKCFGPLEKARKKTTVTKSDTGN